MQLYLICRVKVLNFTSFYFDSFLHSSKISKYSVQMPIYKKVGEIQNPDTTNEDYCLLIKILKPATFYLISYLLDLC